MNSERILWVYRRTNEELIELALKGEPTNRDEIFYSSCVLGADNTDLEEALKKYLSKRLVNKPINLKEFTDLRKIINAMSPSYLRNIHKQNYMPILNSEPSELALKLIRTDRVYIKIGEF